ncbi:MAG: DNA primase, partial [Candidatus Hydrogenedentes bacterium]|nr:DNA primase [Candidatus Hydrogenedentota bacterium]
SFAEALQRLAERAGVKLPALRERDDAEEHQRARLLEVATFAAKRFVEQLNDPLKGGPGRTYLKSRELKPETVRRFGLGYALESWSALVDAVREAGFKDAILETSGLVRKAEGGRVYDFFRNRLMFPIRDVSGRVVAFGGRDLGNEGGAKYINTPENPIYKKGRVLYGLFEAREALRREKSAILVEGYFDLLRCFDAGIENVVAPCGTALTSEQATLLRRYVPEVVLVFDADPAGIRAALRGVGILVAVGLTVRALTLPDGKDPDDYIKAHGAEAFRRLVTEGADFVTFYVRMSESRLKTIEGRTEVAREVFAVLLGFDDEIRREAYLKRIAQELGLNEWTVRSEFGKSARRTSERLPAVSEESASPKVNTDDRDFIAALLRSEPLRIRAKTALSDVSLKAGPVSEVLTGLFERAGTEIGARFDDEASRQLFAAAANAPELKPEIAEGVVEKQITRLRKQTLTQEASRLQEALREAERVRDPARVRELLASKLRINREIERVGAE